MQPHFASFWQKMVRPVGKREGVAHLHAALGLSERRACSIANADRKMSRVASLAMKRGKSVNFTGRWQQHISE
jgi:hypothetical protein